jgi:hypothetical protein
VNTLPEPKKIKDMKRAIYILVILVILTMSSAIYGYLHPQIVKLIERVEVDIFHEVKVPKPYVVVSTVTVTVEKVVVIEKEKIKDRWPDWFVNTPDLQLSAVGLIEPYKGQTECASLFNLGTGESKIVAKKLPMPWAEFKNEWRLGGVVGIDKNMMLSGSWTFGRVGPVETSLNASYISGGEGIIGVGLTYVGGR